MREWINTMLKLIDIGMMECLACVVMGSLITHVILQMLNELKERNGMHSKLDAHIKKLQRRLDSANMRYKMLEEVCKRKYPEHVYGIYAWREMFYKRNQVLLLEISELERELFALNNIKHDIEEVMNNENS